MNKSELIEAVASASGLTKADASKSVEAVFSAISDALKQGDNVRLVGFGTFSATHRAAREAKNPRTGQPIKIAATKVAKFSVGKGLKDSVNG